MTEISKGEEQGEALGTKTGRRVGGCRWRSVAGHTPGRVSPTPVQVAVFLVDSGDTMSPELSRETRTKLCALTTMLSSYQVRALPPTTRTPPALHSSAFSTLPHLSWVWPSECQGWSL